MGFSFSSLSYLLTSEGLRRYLFADHSAMGWRLPPSLFFHGRSVFSWVLL